MVVEWCSRWRRTGRFSDCASAERSPPLEGHVGDQPPEFVIRLYKPVHGRLRLPTPFAMAMELEQSCTLGLHMRGCGNGSIRVDVDFPARPSWYVSPTRLEDFRPRP